MRISLWLGLALLTVAPAAQGPASQRLANQSPALEPVTVAVDRMVASLHLDGAAIAVLRQNGAIHRSEHGRVAGSHVMPISSASKWLAVAVILTLVDDGVLDLDIPVARYVEEFDRPDKEHITLRQCLSCTAGFPARLGGRMKNWGSDEFIAAVADAPLRHGPGNRFLYGGVTFQVAAIAAERATGKTWHQLFSARIAKPLGLVETRFGTLLPIGGEPGTAKLPWVAGGAISSLNDYCRFVSCLLNEGRAGQVQVISKASVETMFRDQVAEQIEVRVADIDVDDVRYGLGTWIFPLEGDAVRVSDPGAFGFTPWIDRDLGVAGVFAVRDRMRRILPRLLAVQKTVRDVVQSPLVSGTDTTVTLARDGRDRHYHLHVPPHSENAADLPLVLVLHGGGGSGEQIARTTRFAGLADREGFVVAFPDGTGMLKRRLLTWNSGGIPVYAADQGIDDTGFLREVAADIARRVPIDGNRVFAVGHSNGGMMCHRLAREAADLFSGIAVVSGAMNFTEADDAMPLGVLIIHGSDDEHVLYHGGEPKESSGRAGKRVDASVQDAISYYVARNALLGYPKSTVDPFDPSVKIDTYGTDKYGDGSWTPLRVITLQGGGHAWPGAAAKTRALADRPFDYDAAQAIWDFFSIVRRVPKTKAGKNGGIPAVPR